MAGLVAGGLAVGYALVQERERVAGAVANVQDTLTNNGLTLMQKLSGMSDAFLAKVHETFVAAAPPTNLEAAVRRGLTGQSDDASAPRHRPEVTRELRTRPREDDSTVADETADDTTSQSEASHRRRRTRHSGPEHQGAPSQHCSSQVVSATARSSMHSAPQAQGSDQGVPTTELALDESDMMDARAESPLTQAIVMGAAPPPVAVAVGNAQTQVALDGHASAQTTTIAQRAQAEPASLLGARLSATWVSEAFVCQVMMIRKGEDGKFEALVKYEADDVEQWEILGEPPYKHTLIAEPTDTWLRTGSALIDARTLERIGSHDFEGVVMAWLPKRDGHDSLYKIYHIADGDFEELDDAEVTAAVSLFNSSATGAVTKE